MGKLSRTKGASYERTLAVRLQPLYPKARRGIGQARSAKEVSDVEGTPFWVEAKHKKCPNIWAALQQAKDATDGRPTLVIARRNQAAPGDGAPELAAMYLADFIALLTELEGYRARALHTPAIEEKTDDV